MLSLNNVIKKQKNASINGDSLTEKPKISLLKNWGRPKKLYAIPAFLLPKEERDALLHYKSHARGRPKSTEKDK